MKLIMHNESKFHGKTPQEHVERSKERLQKTR